MILPFAFSKLWDKYKVKKDSLIVYMKTWTPSGVFKLIIYNFVNANDDF